MNVPSESSGHIELFASFVLQVKTCFCISSII